MKELALKANVSRTAVSMILNGKTNGHISLQKQMRVLELAQHYNFRPNAIARGLRTGKQYSIGILMPVPHTPFYADMATLLQQGIAKRGYMALFSFFATSKNSEVEQAYRSVAGHGVAGVITWEYCHCLSEEKMPVVLYSYGEKTIPGVSMVVPDFNDMAEQALCHLSRLGHTHIAAVGDLSDPRLVLFRSRLEKKGIAVPPEYFRKRIYATEPVGDIVNDLFSLSPKPTAILCHDDLQAAQIHSYLIAIGKRIPDDCALLSFNDSSVLRVLTPSVTAFNMKEEEIANNLIGLLFERLEDANQEDTMRLIHSELQVRSSTHKQLQKGK